MTNKSIWTMKQVKKTLKQFQSSVRTISYKTSTIKAKPKHTNY